MKRTLPIAVVLIFVVCVCFAQSKKAAEAKDAPVEAKSSVEETTSSAKVDTNVPTKEEKPSVKEESKPVEKEKTAPVKLEVKTYSGKVHAVAPGDATEGIQPLIVVEAAGKERMMFKIDDKTSITEGKKTVKLSDLKTGAKAEVNYVMKPVEGMTAVSIKLE